MFKRLLILGLKSGYNIGLEIEKIEKIEKNPPIEKSLEKNQEIRNNEDLPNIKTDN